MAHPTVLDSKTMGNACSEPAPPTGAELSLSEESDTEWKEDTEEATTYPWARRVSLFVERSVSVDRADRVLGA